jgi:hypothetical protein
MADNGFEVEFEHGFRVLYNFGQVVHLKFDIEHVEVSKRSLIGSATFGLAQLVASGMRLQPSLAPAPGTLTVSACEKVEPKAELTILASLEGLKQELSLIRLEFSATNFLEVYRDQAKIYESEWFFNETNYDFRPILLSEESEQ